MSGGGGGFVGRGVIWNMMTMRGQRSLAIGGHGDICKRDVKGQGRIRTGGSSCKKNT